MFKYFPHTDSDIQSMLGTIGVESLDDLFAEIPEAIRFGHDYKLPSALSEQEVRAHFSELGKRNTSLVSFAGAGAYDHYTPSAIASITSRSEFLTAYTPYQPEISQGTLQYIFEFQSMVLDLTGMDCTNASMYDGATATAEAMFMAVASAKKKNKVLISSTVNPNVIRVVQTYAKFKDIEIALIAEKDGVTDKADLQTQLSDGTVAGVITSSPNFYGIVEDYSGFAETIHAAKASFIINADISTLSVLKTPAEWGADIACGDLQTLGMPLSFGGAYAGYLATTKDNMRKLPGRIVGATKDVDGKRAFVLTLQAREQHIRREKSNSNICSNQSLMALHATIYLSLMGKQGLREVNEQSYTNAHYLYEQLLETGAFEPVFNQPFFKEFALRAKSDADVLQKRWLENGILGGVALAIFKPELANCLLFAVTEKRTKEEMDRMVKQVKN